MIASRVVFKRGSLRGSHYIFIVALLFRLVTLARLSGSPLLRPTGSDMLFYHEWALRILHGQTAPQTAFYGLPLYPYWLAFLYKLFGIGSFIPLLFQSVADAGTALLIYKIASRIFAKADTARLHLVGLLAAVGWILFVPAEAYSAALMPTCYGVFAFWFVIWQIVNSSAFTVRRAFWNALIIGLTATAVANTLLALPLLVIAVLLKPARPDRRLVAVFAAACAVILVTSPCWFHNYFIARDPVFLSAHDGINFWIGNNPEANGYPHLPGMRAGQAALLEDSINIAETAAHRSLKRSEVAAYWKAKAREFIIAQPTHWLNLLAQKAGNFFNAFEYDDVGVIAILRQTGIVLPGLHFGLIASLAIPGMLLTVPRFPKARWIAAACLLQLLSILSLFVTERYRLAVVPGLLLFASGGAATFAQAVTKARWQSVLYYIATILVTTLLVLQPRRDPSLSAVMFYNAGRQALETGDLPLAEANLIRAETYVPDNAETTFALGNLRLAQHDTTTARDLYLRVLALDPAHKGALTNLGVLAFDEHDYVAANRYFSAAVQIAPQDAKAYYLLAKLNVATGNYAVAKSEIERAIAIDNTQREFVTLRAEIDAALNRKE